MKTDKITPTRWKMNKTHLSGALCAAIVFASSISNAALVTYTDQAAFMSALPGSANTLGFDNLAANTIITDGDSLEGITFNYNFGSVQMQVSDVFDTTSPQGFLGTDDLDVFQDGDDFGLSFAPVNAVGMFFISADEMFNNDIILSAGGASVGLNTADAGAGFGDGGVPYFLGIIDDVNTFTTADIATIGGGFFLYNVDDITTATVVPLPAALWLFGSGLVGLVAISRKKLGDKP
ncbi:hypothetical protein MNBD_GAMMA10-2510 [hydrothermal vent metagenome]|uniref:Ice-binding protein C-terminal domain-containing protein n=1 Tax=hydrothermal vent metagenome TaxID=652676 RepID=A0A3B0X927_9ZZZZ